LLCVIHLFACAVLVSYFWLPFDIAHTHRRLDSIHSVFGNVTVYVRKFPSFSFLYSFFPTMLLIICLSNFSAFICFNHFGRPVCVLVFFGYYFYAVLFTVPGGPCLSIVSCILLNSVLGPYFSKYHQLF
jgi:hypothetical protein